MQTDPIGYEDQFNLYAYVGNDPINGIDPTGLKRIGSNINDTRGAFKTSAQAVDDWNEAFNSLSADQQGQVRQLATERFNIKIGQSGIDSNSFDGFDSLTLSMADDEGEPKEDKPKKKGGKRGTAAALCLALLGCAPPTATGPDGRPLPGPNRPAATRPIAPNRDDEDEASGSRFTASDAALLGVGVAGAIVVGVCVFGTAGACGLVLLGGTTSTLAIR